MKIRQKLARKNEKIIENPCRIKGFIGVSKVHYGLERLSPKELPSVALQKRGVKHSSGLIGDELIHSNGKNLTKPEQVINDNSKGK